LEWGDGEGKYQSNSNEYSILDTRLTLILMVDDGTSYDILGCF